MSATQRQYASEVLYIDYMSSEDSDYEEIEDPITGERERKLACYVPKKLPWEKTNLTSLKSRLDRACHNSLSLHARAMSKPRQVGGLSARPAPKRPILGCQAARRGDCLSFFLFYLSIFF